MKKLSLSEAHTLVCEVTNLPDDAGAEWIISRAAQGLLPATARSEEWIRPTLDLDGEKEAFESYLALVGDIELLAYVRFALDMAQDGIPLTWEHHFREKVEIQPEFWSWREVDEELWKTTSFLGRHDKLPAFRYNLVGIEMDRDQLEDLLRPYRPDAPPLDNVLRLVSINDRPPARVSELEESNKPKRRRGRPEGTGYHEDDAPLVKLMSEMIADGVVRSPTAAARALASRAVGGAQEENKARRLVNRFMEEKGEK